MSRFRGSQGLREAVNLYGFVEKSIAQLTSRSQFDAAALAANRRALTRRLSELSAAIDTEKPLSQAPDLYVQMKSLVEQLTAAWTRHQTRYPVERAGHDLDGYIKSAEEVKQLSARFRQWCDIHLDY